MKHQDPLRVPVIYWYCSLDGVTYHLKFSKQARSFSISHQTLVSRVCAQVMNSVLPVVNCALQNLNTHPFNHAYAPPKTSGVEVPVRVWRKKSIIVLIHPGQEKWTMCMNGQKAEFPGPFPFELMGSLMKLTISEIKKQTTPY